MTQDEAKEVVQHTFWEFGVRGRAYMESEQLCLLLAGEFLANLYLHIEREYKVELNTCSLVTKHDLAVELVRAAQDRDEPVASGASHFTQMVFATA